MFSSVMALCGFDLAGPVLLVGLQPGKLPTKFRGLPAAVASSCWRAICKLTSLCFL